MPHDTYWNKADAEADRAQQQSLLTALQGWQRALRRDECNAWGIVGSSGRILTWGDGKSWIIYVDRGWRSAKRRMAGFAIVTQSGDTEGCIKLDRLPTPNEATIIRDVIGLRKRPAYTDEVLATKRASALRARSILNSDSGAQLRP